MAEYVVTSRHAILSVLLLPRVSNGFLRHFVSRVFLLLFCARVFLDVFSFSSVSFLLFQSNGLLLLTSPVLTYSQLHPGY
jgi:hypothetical protein